MKKDMINKALVTGVIFFFIGVSCSTAISVDKSKYVNSNIQIRDDYSIDEAPVEFMVSTYGIGKTDDFKVLLTQKQVDKLDMVINELNFKLKNSKTNSQTFSSLKWAFNNFKELNLFKNYNDYEIMQLLFGIFLNLNSKSETKLTNYDGKENFDCIISGNLSLSVGLGFGGGEGPILEAVWWFLSRTIILQLLLFPFVALVFLYRQCYGKEHGGFIIIGEKEEGTDEWHYPIINRYPVNCDIFTNGSNGIVTWAGEQYGQLDWCKRFYWS
jgi:hypothetical protein